MNSHRLVLPSAALLIAAAAVHASDVRVQKVFVSGDSAPGLGPIGFDFFSDPRLNTAGNLAFWADLAGPGVSENNNGSIWSNRSGTFALVAREGDPVPSGTGLVFGSLPAPAFNSQDRVAFTASLFDPLNPTNPTALGLFRELSPGPGFEAVAIEGAPAGCPTCPPDDILNIGLAPFNLAGHQAFTSNNGVFMWSTLGGALATYPGAGAGASVPGLSGQFLGRLGNPYQSAAGRLVFFAPIRPTGTINTQPSAYGLFSTFGGPVASVAITGQPVAATAAIKYKEVSAHPALERATAASARMAYWASLMEGGVTPINDTSLWVNPSQSAGVARLREGDPAPGTGGGVFFGGFSRHPSLAATPTQQYFLAFQATLVGTGISNLNNSGVWLAGQSGSPSLIAREGEQVPRLPAGTFYAWFSDPAVNAAGQVVFFARLKGPSVAQATSLVLMATERTAGGTTPAAGSVTPIARMGDAFEVSPGVLRTVDEIYFDQHQPGAGADALSDDGSLVFKMAFKDPITPPPPPPNPPFSFANGLFTATIRCLADINADGALTIADFGAFQASYASSNLRVCDFSEDGLLTIADFGAFQSAFVSGCP